MTCFKKIINIAQVLIITIVFPFCSVDYSVLEDRYCTSSGECAAGYVCDPNTGKCVKEGELKDYGESKDILLPDILGDGATGSDVRDVIQDYEELKDFGSTDSEYNDIPDDISGGDFGDTHFGDGGCISECTEENRMVCVSPDEYRICIKNGNCLVWVAGRSCEADQFCDMSDNKCKEQVCKPFEKGCDNQVAYKCNRYGSDFEYAVDCLSDKKICQNGECISCQADCSDKCKDEDDGCFGKCPDPCNGNGSCSKGVCTCNTGFEPPYCDKCSDGYTGYPDCVKCGGDKEICCENQKCNVLNQVCTYGVCRTRCPDQMVRIDNSDVCIDTYEASKDGNKAASVKGANPWVNLTKNEAQSACNAAGKRLCSISEWSYACKGPNNYIYPYGNTYESQRCVDLNAGDKCNNGDGSGVMPAGSRIFCEGGFAGIFDMSGNVWEWVQDTDASGCKLMGGSVDCCNRGNDKPVCLSCNSLGTQRCDLKWSALGFRCCKDVP